MIFFFRGKLTVRDVIILSESGDCIIQKWNNQEDNV